MFALTTILGTALRLQMNIHLILQSFGYLRHIVLYNLFFFLIKDTLILYKSSLASHVGFLILPLVGFPLDFPNLNAASPAPNEVHTYRAR